MLSGLSSKSLSISGTIKAIGNTQKKSSNENSSSDQTQNSDAKENTNSSAIKDKVALNKVTKFKDGIVSERIKDIGNMALKDQVEAKFPVPDTSKSSASAGSQSSPGAASPQNQTPQATPSPNFGLGGQGQNPGGGFAGGGGSPNSPWLGQPNVQNPPHHGGGNNETQSLSSFANNLLKNHQIASYQLNNHNGHMDLELKGVQHGAMDSIQKYAQQHNEQLTAKCDANGCSVDLNAKDHQEQGQEVQRQQEQQSQQNAAEQHNDQQQVA